MLVLRLLIGDVVPLNQMVLFLVLIGNVVRLTRRFALVVVMFRLDAGSLLIAGSS